MRTGSSWLFAGVIGAALVGPVAAFAQGTDGTGTPGPVVGPTSTQALGTFRPPAPIRPGQQISVLVFPFSLAGGEMMAPADPAAMPAAGAAPAGPLLTPEQQAAVTLLTANVKAGLLSTPSYSVMTYHSQSSLVLRGRKDDILRQDDITDVTAPGTGALNVEKAKTITYRLGIQSYLSGTIDLKVDPKANTAEVTLETQLTDSTSGQAIRSAAVTGSAAGAEGVPMTLIVERAAQDAAMKAIPALGVELRAMPEKGTGEGHKNGKMKPAKESKEEREARKQAERDAKKAEVEARAAAKRQKEADEKARKEAEKARKEAEKAEKSRRASGRTVKVAAVDQEDAPMPFNVAQAQPAQPQPPAAQPPAAGSSTVQGSAGIVPGAANAAGQPVPYGYAIGESENAVPQRRRKGIRVPSWLSLAAFLTGVSFLL